MRAQGGARCYRPGSQGPAHLAGGETSMRRIRFGAISVVMLTCGVLALAQQTPPPAQGAQQGTAAQGAPPAGRQGGGRGGRGGGGAQRKRVLAWADTRNGQAQH